MSSHAVSRLRSERLARSLKPFVSRGSRSERCPVCRVIPSYCLCAWRPRVEVQAGVCLLMYDVEALKPSNTGWLIADLVADTHAFGWQRTEVDPRLLALLDDPQYAPCVVFPGEYAEPEREQLSRYRLRRSKRDEHLCTAEVAALCLELAGEPRAAQALDAWLDLFTEHYLSAKHRRVLDEQSPAHQAIRPFL